MKKELENKLAGARKKHGEKSVIGRSVPVSEGDEATGYFLHPDFHPNMYSLYSRVMTFLRKDKPVEAGTLIVNETWIGGDERILDKNSKIHLSVGQNLVDELGFLPVASTVSS